MTHGTALNISRRTLLASMAGAIALVGTACGAAAGDSQEDSSPAGETTDPRPPVYSFDMHADTIDALGMISHTPYANFNNKFSGSLVDTNAQISTNRMGGVRWAQCYAIWIPDAEGDLQADIPAIDWYHEGVAWFKQQMEEHSDTFTQVRKFSDIPPILDEGKVAAAFAVADNYALGISLFVQDNDLSPVFQAADAFRTLMR